MKFESCCAGTPGQPKSSPGAGDANGLQNGTAFTWSFSCASHQYMRSEPWTEPVVMTTPGNGLRRRRPVYGSRAPGSGANKLPRMSAPYRFVYAIGLGGIA